MAARRYVPSKTCRCSKSTLKLMRAEVLCQLMFLSPSLKSLSIGCSGAMMSPRGAASACFQDPNSQNWILLWFCNITALDRSLHLTYGPSYLWLRWIGITFGRDAFPQKPSDTKKSFIVSTCLKMPKRNISGSRTQRAILDGDFINIERHFKSEIHPSHFLWLHFDLIS